MKEKFQNSQFLVLFSRTLASLVSGVILLFLSKVKNVKSKSTAPFYVYSFCSLSNIMSSWFNYESLKLVSFTTTILFKERVQLLI